MPPETIRPKMGLEARNLWKYFGDFAALRAVSLAVARGECALLYGPNGAGKTTLLRTLALLAEPSEGEVLLDGQRTSRSPSVKMKIGFVSHATLLYNDLTVEENLALTGKLFGLGRLAARIEASLTLFDLRDRARQPVRSLSRGLQQRVSLARALLHDPEFILLDEPFTGLDAVSASALEMLLRRLPDEGKAVVFSTHEYARGSSIARRVVLLQQGRVRYDGPVVGAPAVAPEVAVISS
ncbi:MAG: ABC transporter ATP-binding protein [Terriglobia bacterium]